MVYGVSREMTQPEYGGFSRVDREELDDEHIIVCPSRSTHVAVILQPNAGVDFATIFGDVAWHVETSRKTRVVHGAPECLGTGPFRAKAASFVIVMAPTMWVPCAWLELRAIIP
jgi:hypothetical protein